MQVVVEMVGREFGEERRQLRVRHAGGEHAPLELHARLLDLGRDGALAADDVAAQALDDLR
jgi:hypothetical protein